MELERCPDCQTKLIVKTNETYCPKCGLVVDPNPVDFGMDWDNWDGDNDEKSRAGKPLRYIDGDITKTPPTEIGNKKERIE